MMKNINFEENEERLLAGTYQKIPVVAARAEGTRIWDAEGKEYLDFMSGYGVAILGHSFPAVKEAIRKQLDEVYITHASVYSPARSSFLSELSSVLPWNSSRMFLSNSGAEAVEAAIKIALKYTGRKKFISMEKAYHGKTIGALSLTHSNKYRKSFGDIIYPNVEFLKFGDIEQLKKSLQGEDVAAVFLEPVQGEGGINLPPEEYMKSVREITEETGTLLVLDEIQSGLGRTGKMWAHQHWGISPDIMTIGKGIGGGLPMGVTAGRSDIVATLEIGEQSSTTGGNPLACAAGVAVLKELRNGYVKRAETQGAYLLKRMREEIGEHRLVASPRGIGMMLAVELKIRFLPVLMNQIQGGLITLYSGFNTIRLLPPYIITEQDADAAVGIMKQALDRQLENSRVS